MAEKERVIVAISREARVELDHLRMELMKAGQEPTMPNLRRATEIAIEMALGRLREKETVKTS